MANRSQSPLRKRNLLHGKEFPVLDFLLGNLILRPEQLDAIEIANEWKREYEKFDNNVRITEWLFPILECGLYAPAVTKGELEYLKHHSDIKAAVQRNLVNSLKMALLFYGMRILDNDHIPRVRRADNYWDRYANFVSKLYDCKRLCRIIKCLSIFDLDSYQFCLVYFLNFEINLSKELNYPLVKTYFLNQWAQSFKPNSDFKAFFSELPVIRFRKRTDDTWQMPLVDYEKLLDTLKKRENKNLFVKTYAELNQGEVRLVGSRSKSALSLATTQNETPDERPNIDFLCDRKRLPAGTISEIHQNWWKRYDLLDSEVGYLDWLFPTFSTGKSLESRPLTLQEIDSVQEFQEMQKISSSLLSSLQLMFAFYDVSFNAVEVVRNENYREGYNYFLQNKSTIGIITQILECLSIFSMKAEIKRIVDFLLFEIFQSRNFDEPRLRNEFLHRWLNFIENKEAKESLRQKALYRKDPLINLMFQLGHLRLGDKKRNIHDLRELFTNKYTELMQDVSVVEWLFPITGPDVLYPLSPVELNGTSKQDFERMQQSIIDSVKMVFDSIGFKIAEEFDSLEERKVVSVKRKGTYDDACLAFVRCTESSILIHRILRTLNLFKLPKYQCALLTSLFDAIFKSTELMRFPKCAYFFYKVWLQEIENDAVRAVFRNALSDMKFEDKHKHDLEHQEHDETLLRYSQCPIFEKRPTEASVIHEAASGLIADARFK